MMSLKLQILIGVCILLIMIYITNMVRKKKIDLRFALGWMLIGVVVLILTIWPGILNAIAKLLGIASPVNMLFFFGFCFSLCLIFSLAMALSHLNDKVKKMAQEIAIMKKGIYETSREGKENEGKKS